MISTLLATMALGPVPKPMFTLMLVAGNKHRFTEPKMVTEPSDDKMVLAIQKIVARSDQTKEPWSVIEGANIGDLVTNRGKPTVTIVSGHYESYVSSSQTVTTNGKTKTVAQGTTTTKHLESLAAEVSSENEGSLFFLNFAFGPEKQDLMLTNLGAMPRIAKEKPKDYIEYLKNSMAVSSMSVLDTETWLDDLKGSYRPTMVLCASGRPQDGHRDLLAFPSAGVILTYQVTFDKRWSAKLKDIIRVQ